MFILDPSLRMTGDSVRTKRQLPDDFRDEIRPRGQRGVRAERAEFDYTGSVMAGPNGWPPAAPFDELTGVVPEIARTAGDLETEAARGEMGAVVGGLTEQIDAWRQAGAH